MPSLGDAAGSTNSAANSEYGQQRQVASALDMLIGSRANSRANLMKAPQKSFRLKNLAQLQKQLEDAMRMNISSGPSSHDLDENNDLSQLGAYLNSQNDYSGITDASDDHSAMTPEDAGDDIEPTSEEINARRQRYSLAFDRFRNQHALKASDANESLTQTGEKVAQVHVPLTGVLEDSISSFDDHLEYGGIRREESDCISGSFSGLKRDGSHSGVPNRLNASKSQNSVGLREDSTADTTAADAQQGAVALHDDGSVAHSVASNSYLKKNSSAGSNGDKLPLVHQLTAGSKNSESTEDSFFNWSPAISRQGTQSNEGFDASKRSEDSHDVKTTLDKAALRLYESKAAAESPASKQPSKQEIAAATMEAAIASAIVAGKDPRDLMDMMIGSTYQMIIDSPSPSKARKQAGSSPPGNNKVDSGPLKSGNISLLHKNAEEGGVKLKSGAPENKHLGTLHTAIMDCIVLLLRRDRLCFYVYALLVMIFDLFDKHILYRSTRYQHRLDGPVAEPRKQRRVPHDRQRHTRRCGAAGARHVVRGPDGGLPRSLHYARQPQGAVRAFAFRHRSC